MRDNLDYLSLFYWVIIFFLKWDFEFFFDRVGKVKRESKLSRRYVY